MRILWSARNCVSSLGYNAKRKPAVTPQFDWKLNRPAIIRRRALLVTGSPLLLGLHISTTHKNTHIVMRAQHLIKQPHTHKHIEWLFGAFFLFSELRARAIKMTTCAQKCIKSTSLYSQDSYIYILLWWPRCYNHIALVCIIQLAESEFKKMNEFLCVMKLNMFRALFLKHKCI